VFLVPLILTTGSRSGALLMIASLVVTTILWAAHQLTATQSTRAGAKVGRRATIIGIVATIVVGSAAVVFVAVRSPAFERLFAEQMDGEYRVQLLPYLSEMIWKYFPFGSGFGTFELAFKSIEPLILLKPQYLNQAHNDGMQILIEGGLPAGIIVAMFLGWFVVCGWRHLSKLVRSVRSGSRQPTVDAGPFAWTAMAVLLAGSVADYPLRVPSIMLYAVVLCVLINVPATAKRKVPSVRASNAN
jgi:O-antigen ligase